MSFSSLKTVKSQLARVDEVEVFLCQALGFGSVHPGERRELNALKLGSGIHLSKRILQDSPEVLRAGLQSWHLLYSAIITDVSIFQSSRVNSTVITFLCLESKESLYILEGVSTIDVKVVKNISHFLFKFEWKLSD